MRKLKLKINDKEYTLEYNRDSIKWLEAMGFVYGDFEKKPITYRDLLWTSLFVKNYPEINPIRALELMEEYTKVKGAVMTNKVVKFASTEYLSFINALTDTNSEKMEEELEIIEQ